MHERGSTRWVPPSFRKGNRRNSGNRRLRGRPLQTCPCACHPVVQGTRFSERNRDVLGASTARGLGGRRAVLAEDALPVRAQPPQGPETRTADPRRAEQVAGSAQYLFLQRQPFFTYRCLFFGGCKP